jgi:hypothetical protein
MLSDALQSWAGDESLRYALLALCPGTLWCAWYLRQASKTVVRDIAFLGVGKEDVAPREQLLVSRPLKASRV